MDDDYYLVEDDDKYFNLTVINFWMIFWLVMLKTMGGFTVEIGRK